MEFVEPIKDLESIKAIKDYLKKHSKRDYLLFVFGINTGIRISEWLQIKVYEVWDGREAYELITIHEKNTQQKKHYYLNSNVQAALKEYIELTKISANQYLFKSKHYEKPISRQQAYQMINKVTKEIGQPGQIGTHTIRKTFGYHAYRKGIAVSILRSIFGHGSNSETLKYIGITKDEEHHIKVDVNL
ncbi:tyrosine-type recombinase/integrase [Bacillaceae bacterium W0354]